jgi:hypothetical protein
LREPCESVVDQVVTSVEDELDQRFDGQLHVVVYHSNATARVTLDRVVPASMLLVPWQTSSAAVVAVQSVAAHVVNGDVDRMRRKLAHEFAHVAAALRTGSEKCLGDGDRSMRILSWVNEGFACVVSAVVCDRTDLLDREAAHEALPPTTDLNIALSDLNHAHRSAAFAVATARVWRAVRKYGLRRVFGTLATPELWDDPADQ